MNFPKNYTKLFTMNKSEMFRHHHFQELLRSFDTQKGPLDLFISLYFRHNPQLGSKDRLFIVERIYKYFRWKNRIEAFLDRHQGTNNSREDLLMKVLEEDFSSIQDNVPENVCVGFPKELYDAFERSWGDRTQKLCLLSNEPAPITIRVNTLKTTPQELLQKLLAQGLPVEEVPGAPHALRFLRRSNFFSLPEFQAGLFEVQDAGSQGVAEIVNAKPGDQILDYCAGAGGKSLAIAPRVQNKGQLFLHDIRPEALLQAKKRLRRAGVQNAQIVPHDDTRRLSFLKRRMDWVIVDAPCSGTGTLRRNPDMKWKFSLELLQRLVNEQREIFSQALQFLSPTGRIVYATCSLLREENEEQVQYFLDHFPLSCTEEHFRSSPFSGMDGFFAATFSLQLRK